MKTNQLETEIDELARELWEVIRQSEGSAVAELVAEVRDLSRRRRNGDETSAQRMQTRIAALTADEFDCLIAAFSIFFDLANLAEDRQRVRVLRRRQSERDDGARPESIGDALRGLSQRGLSAEQVQSILDHLRIELVFTAHPTEAKRKSVREKIRDLRRHLAQLDNGDLLPDEVQRLNKLKQGDLFTLWHTDLLRQRKPTVLEEVHRALFFATTLWDVIPRLQDDFQAALDQYFPNVHFNDGLPIRFGSWIGGDRDGHPGVTCEVTRQTLHALRDAAIELHLAQCRGIRRSLSLSDQQCEIASDLVESLEDYLRRFPEAAEIIEPIAPPETCRRFLRIIEWRLEKTRGPMAFPMTPAPTKPVGRWRVTCNTCKAPWNEYRAVTRSACGCVNGFVNYTPLAFT